MILNAVRFLQIGLHLELLEVRLLLKKAYVMMYSNDMLDFFLQRITLKSLVLMGVVVKCRL